MRKLTPTQIITELLRTYQDVTATLNSEPDWIGDKPGSRYLIRPDNHPYFTGSYRQLEDVLRYMRDGGPSNNHRDRKKVQAKYWAVNAEYISCEHKLVDHHHHRKAKKGTVPTIERRRHVIAHVNKRELEHGIVWITAEFRRRNLNPWLPPEVYAIAADVNAPQPGVVGYAA